MPSFVDIAPLQETVTLRGLEFPVHGIGIDDLAALVHRFPVIGTLFPTAVRPGTPAPEIDAVSIISLGPQIVGALIACATDKAGDDAEEAALAKLTIADHFPFVEAIISLSVPGGALTPFIQRVIGLISGEPPAAPVDDGRAPDTNSPPPSTS